MLGSLGPGGEVAAGQSVNTLTHHDHPIRVEWSDPAGHDKLFRSKAGANRFSMTAILNGEQCGVCHGAVAFPLTECNRCHSVPNASLRRHPAP